MNIERWMTTKRLTEDQKSAAKELKERGIETFTDAVFAIGEPALAIISSSIAEPIAGLAGIGMTAFEGIERGTDTIESVKQRLSYVPKTKGGKIGMGVVSDTLAPVGELISSAEDYLGETTLDATGSPILAAAAATIPAAIGELNPLGKVSKRASKMDIFAGKKAKTADLKKAAIAEELMARGVSRDEIWKETGWFKDVDDQWKFEIEDSGFSTLINQKKSQIKELENNLFEVLKREGMDSDEFKEARAITQKMVEEINAPLINDRLTSLDKLIDGGEVFDAYPEIGKTNSAFDLGGKSGEGSYNAYNNTLRASGDPESIRSTALHETQHIIQENEGFARGGSPARLEGEKIELASEIDWRNKQIAELTKQAKDTPKYKAIESRLIEALESGDEARISDLISDQNKYLNDFPHLSRHKEKVWELADKKDKIGDPYEAYQRLAGEAEARNVQARMNFTPEERAARAPWTTLDVPEDELIVNGGVSKRE